MIKRFSFVLAALALLPLLFAGCDSAKSIREPVPFYYMQKAVTYGTDNGLIGFEQRESRNKAPEELISSYLNGPVSSQLVNPFPKGTKLLSMTVESSTVTLVLSDKYATLTGISLTAANACLSKTVFALTEAQTISIECKSKLLDGQESILINRDSFLLLDQPSDAPVSQSETQSSEKERN